MAKSVFYFSLVRTLFLALLVGIAALLYWSSLLIEEKQQTIQQEIDQLREELEEIRKEKTAPASFFRTPDTETPIEGEWLSHDPFYTTTLPRLLGPRFKPHGVRKEAIIGRPEHLHPFSNWSNVATWNSLCTGSVATEAVGIYEAFVPDMALKIEKKTSPKGAPEYWIFLRKGLFWQPLNPAHLADSTHISPFFLKKHPVTAHDFKFYVDAILNPFVEEPQAVALRNYLTDIEEIRVIDDTTFTVSWKTDPQGRPKYLIKSLTASLRPLPSFVYQFFSDGSKIVNEQEEENPYRTSRVWAQNFSHHWAKGIIVSCGPWLFNGISDAAIRFKRNPDHYNPLSALFEEYEVRFKDDPDAIWNAFKANELDLVALPPDQLAELTQFLKTNSAQKEKIRTLDYLERSYNYVGWNLAHPLFRSKKVRQALTMAIDRQRIIRQYLNGMGWETTGSFFPGSPSYDRAQKPYPYAPLEARRLLAEEGWSDDAGKGVLQKNIDGEERSFIFTLTYYAKNQISRAICSYIATSLKKIGIICHPDGVDSADLSAAFEDKNFEAIFLGWALGEPPEDPKQLWYSSGAKERGSSNAVGFSNPAADKLIEQLEYTENPAERIKLYHQFDALLYDELPYTFLFTPKALLVYRSYLHNVFIPAERQDLIPGANMVEPVSAIQFRGDESS